MTEEQLDRVYELENQISDRIKRLTNAVLKNEDADVQELVRTRLGENFRFWYEP